MKLINISGETVAGIFSGQVVELDADNAQRLLGKFPVQIKVFNPPAPCEAPALQEAPVEKPKKKARKVPQKKRTKRIKRKKKE